MNLHSNIKATCAIAPVDAAPTGNTPIVSTIVDRQGFGDLELLIVTGVLADASAEWVVKLEHGDDSGLSDAADVPDGSLRGTEVISAAAPYSWNQTHDSKVFKIGYSGAASSKRYVRATVTPANNAGAGAIAGIWVQGQPSVVPQSAQLA